MSTTPKCNHCDHCDLGWTNSLHSLECPKLTLSEAIAHATRANSRDRTVTEWWRKQIQLAQHWEGKYRIVKHENNQLRKKLDPQPKR